MIAVQHIHLWQSLVFKTTSYTKNFDISIPNENFITEHDGKISMNRYIENRFPRIIGEYGLSTWNIELANELDVDIYDLLVDQIGQDIYFELKTLIDDDLFDMNDYSKIVFLHTCILEKKYRKSGVIEELTEMLYRDFYGDDVAIIALVKPFQDNEIDSEYLLNLGRVETRDQLDNDEVNYIDTRNYYELDEFFEKDDRETNEYKLYAVANKCGFDRISESPIFQYSPDKTINRMKEKKEYIENL